MSDGRHSQVLGRRFIGIEVADYAKDMQYVYVHSLG